MNTDILEKSTKKLPKNLSRRVLSLKVQNNQKSTKRLPGEHLRKGPKSRVQIDKTLTKRLPRKLSRRFLYFIVQKSRILKEGAASDAPITLSMIALLQYLFPSRSTDLLLLPKV
jgi:hypothetical protein